MSAPSARARASLPAPDQDTSDALFNQLRKTEAELGGAAGAASWMRLARRVAELRSESPRVGRVVLCGGTPVSAGEALWVVPQPPEVGEDSTDEERSAASALVPQDLHWEMFSCDELPLVARWDKLPDPNDAEADRDLERDMSIEIPSLIRQIEAGTEVGEDDQRLTIEELNDFYASEGSHALRQTQYRFCSEWGLDLELARARAAELGFRRSPAFWRLIAAYQWWEEAAAAEGFPASPVVWHYHPVAFMELYQSLLRGEA